MPRPESETINADSKENSLKESYKSPLILIVSTKYDPHADFLTPKLREKGVNFVRFNTEDFPMRSNLTVLSSIEGDKQILVIPGKEALLGEDITSVWYRRPAAFEFPGDFSKQDLEFAKAESRAAIAGLWQVLNCMWVNHPEKNRLAEYKIGQLKLAKQIGFSVPETIVTNDPQLAKRFYDSLEGKKVIKCLARGLAIEGLDFSAIYTSIVTPKYMEEIDNIRVTPVLLQEYVKKEMELRVTVVGDEVFTAEILSQESKKTKVDWRRDVLSLTHREHKLPDNMANKCRALTKSYGLEFGAIDMILTPKGEYIFLELNPNGQWAWVEMLTGLPISEAMVRLLSRVK